MTDESTDRLYQMEASVIRALGSPARLAIVDLLAKGGRSVQEIAEDLDMAPASASRHLAGMHSAGLVQSRKEKQRVYYALTCPCVLRLLSPVRELLQHNRRRTVRALRNT